MCTSSPSRSARRARSSLEPCRTTARSAHRPRVGTDARQLRCNSRLVADIELQEHRGERLDRGCVRKFAGIEWTAAGDLPHDLADRRHGVRVVAADQHVAVDRLAEMTEFGGGQMMERSHY